MNVDFFFDPICPWCWMTSRWMVEVQPKRDLTVRWRSFSLLEENRDTMSPEYLERVSAGHNALRVAEALRAGEGEAAVGDFYTELGSRIHYDKIDLETIDIGDVLTTVNLPAKYTADADDEKWDAVISASIKEALDLAGTDVGVPLISFDGHAAYFGPVVNPTPQGEEALQLWDLVVGLAHFPGFFELKNSDRGKPQLGSRPS